MHKFKKGDRVRVIPDEALWRNLGYPYGVFTNPYATVTQAPTEPTYVWVQWDDKPADRGHGGYHAAAFQKAIDPVDLALPVQTRAGWKVFSINPESDTIRAMIDHPVKGRIELTFGPTGYLYKDLESPVDLVNG